MKNKKFIFALMTGTMILPVYTYASAYVACTEDEITAGTCFSCGNTCSARLTPTGGTISSPSLVLDDDIIDNNTQPAQKLTISGSGAMTVYDNPTLTPWWSRKDITSIEVEGNTYNEDGSIKTQGITSISQGAFMNRNNLTSVTIGDSVTSIGMYAFYETRLGSVTLPDSVTTIGDGAFRHAGLSGAVVIPDSVTTIGDEAFSGNSNINSLSIGKSVTSIGDSAFYEANLGSVVIPDSVTSIGMYAFYYNDNLTSVIIGDSVTTIGEWAFAHDNLTSVIIGDSVTTIGEGAFLLPSNAKVFCPTSAGGTTSVCSGKIYDRNYTLNEEAIELYTKGDDGIYITTDGKTYATPQDMQNDNACTTDCAERVAAYKDAKAASMVGSNLCSTKKECLNLIDMASDSKYACTTIASCGAYAKDPENNIVLADLYNKTETPSALVRADKRIYTIDEANKVAGKVNRVSIKYR